MIVNENFEVAKKEKTFLVLSFGFPALLTPFPLLTDSYGQSRGWCWITEYRNINQMWMIIEFYGPFVLIFFLNIFSYYKIYQRIWAGDSLTFEIKVMKKLLGRLKLYPISLIICFGIATVHRLYYASGGSKNAYLDLIAGCTLSLYGFINSIVYGFTRSVRNSIKRTFNNILFPSDNSYRSTSADNLIKN